jgi:tetratricopeptide (TPR) repeat protein
MGDRASYAIRDQGRIELFYGNWGAPTLLADVFWGPEVCEASIRRQEPADEWLDDVYGEAAVALCKDTRTVTFYDGWGSDDARETAARMMAALWPGWTVHTASLVSGVAAAVGVDLVSQAPPSPRAANALDAATRPESGQIPRAALILQADGTLRVSSEPLVGLLPEGPALLDALPLLPTLDEAREALWTRAAPAHDEPAGLLEVDGSGTPGLLDLDEARRILRVTLLPGLSAAGDLTVLRDLPAHWPGWTVTVGIGSVEDAFAERPVPAGLSRSPSPRPLADQLRELAPRLLGDDAFRAWAASWLAGVAASIGAPGVAAGGPVPLPLEPAARQDRWERALRTLPLSDADVREAARPPPEPEVRRELVWEGFPRSEVLAAGAVVVPGHCEVAVRQPMVDGCPTGPATLLIRTDSSPPRPLCGLTAGPIRSPNVRGVPGIARLHPSPSGRAVLAVVETRPYSLVWVDLVRGTAAEIGVASRVARFRYDARVAWAPDADRFAVELVDELDGRCGAGCVVVYDADAGWIGEAARAGWARWGDDGALWVHRFDGASLVPRRIELHGGDEVRARARMTGTGAGTAGEALRLEKAAFADRVGARAVADEQACAAFEADPASPAAFDAWARVLRDRDAWDELARVCDRHLACTPEHRDAWDAAVRACLGARDPARAVAVAARGVEHAPFSVMAHWYHAWALTEAGELEAGAVAAVRAAGCNPYQADRIALDEDLQPLWGHPAFAPLDYRRLLQRASGADSEDDARTALRAAVACLPTGHEAHERLVALEQEAGDLVAAWAAVESWHGLDAVAAGPTRCALLVELGRLDEAERAAAALLARDDQAFLGYLQLARIAARRGDDEAARAHLAAGEDAFPRSRPHPWATFAGDHALDVPELTHLLPAEA